MRLLLVGLLCFAFADQAFAQEVKISASDNTQSVVTAQKGKRITLRLRSGQELTGTVREATAALVVLGALTGRDFFDAVIPMEAVEAVLIRTKQ